MRMLPKEESTAMTSTSDYYKGKVAVVTGAASGIGLALSETILSYGADKVVLADFNDENLARETARLEQIYPGKTLGVHCDVTKESDVQAMIAKASAAGRVDFLFNNAGLGFNGRFEDQTNANWEKMFALNFYGALYGIRAVLPIMRKQGGGHIVDIISGVGLLPQGYMTMYAASKAALNGLTLALRYELWDDNIRLTSATPGTVVTAIWKGSTPPPTAQSPQKSAQTILAGVAKNLRLVLGDDDDLQAALASNNPDKAELIDQHFADSARQRRAGAQAF
jgi:NAD(P)-dependent dehydrogenase (short-subunit alcohol dehydrogenase family)